MNPLTTTAGFSTSSLVALNLVWLRSWTEGWGVRVAVVDLLFSGYVALIPVTDAFRGVVALHLLIDGFAVYWLTRPFARLALLRRRRFSATREAAERTRRRLNDVVANAPLPMAQAIEDLHVDADTVTASELDRAQHEYPGARGRHLQHLLVRHGRELPRVGDDPRIRREDA